MNWKHNLSYYLLKNASSFYKYKRNGLRILAYHSIDGTAYQDNIGLYSVSSTNFKDQIKSLSEYKDIYLTKIKNENIDGRNLKTEIWKLYELFNGTMNGDVISDEFQHNLYFGIEEPAFVQ